MKTAGKLFRKRGAQESLARWIIYQQHQHSKKISSFLPYFGCWTRGFSFSRLFRLPCFDKNANEMFFSQRWKIYFKAFYLIYSRHLCTKTTKKYEDQGTYRRICHAPSHLIWVSVWCRAVSAREAPRRWHFHFVRWIHGHCTHATARRKIFFELQRFGRAFERSWRINFAAFYCTLPRKKYFRSTIFQGFLKSQKLF